MSGQSAEILRRKASGAGQAAAVPAAMTPQKAYGLAFGRAGRALQGLDLRLSSFRMERLSVAAVVEAAPDPVLLMTLARRDGVAGVLMVDAGMAAALIECETMGKLAREAPAPRPATRIDALIVAAFADAALAGFDEIGADLSIAPSVTGFRSGEMLSAPKMLPLLLEDVPMRLTRLGFAFGQGGREGAMLIAQPLDPVPPARAAEVGDTTARDLEAVVMAAPAEIHAILARVPMPLEAVTDWQAGDLLPLDREVLDSVVIEDRDGAPLAGGRLGQANGNRAVRLRMG